MERMYSPWRSQYVSHAADEGEGCIFCRFPRESDDASNMVAHRGGTDYVVLNRYP